LLEHLGLFVFVVEFVEDLFGLLELLDGFLPLAIIVQNDRVIQTDRAVVII